MKKPKTMTIKINHYSQFISLFIVSILFVQTSVWAKNVNVTEAGTLQTTLGSMPNNDKQLTVTGVINGTDIKYIRQLISNGKVKSLDLSGVSIVSGGNAYYESFTTEDNVIGEKMFYNCSNLQTILLPTNITSIQNNAFTSSGLTEIDIPNSVRTVGFDAFAYCNNLTKAVIGKRAKLSQGVFWGSNVHEAYVKAMTPPDIPPYLFSSNPTIYVYEEAYADYQETEWSTYGTMYNTLATYYPQEDDPYADVKQKCSTYFEDDACTQLKSTYQTMRDSKLRSTMQNDGMPEVIINMALKIKNNTWAAYEKDFRIHSYNAYSDAKYWNDKLWARCASYMGNPTGIITQTNSDQLYVFVDADVPSDATLYIAGVEADKMISKAKTGQKLVKGLNVIDGDAGNYYYILYTADTKSMTKKLNQWPDIKIHIEGGTLDGYFDASRHTDADYRTLLNAASFTSFVLKGKHSVMSIWKSILTDKYPNNIAKAVECTDSLSVWEKDLIGITESVYNGEKAGEPWYLTGGDAFYPSYFNNPTYVDNDSPGSYAHANEFGIHLSEDASEVFINPYLTDVPGYDEGGIAHEFGHQLQSPIMLEGVTEGSNDLFSNVCRFLMGHRASTGRPLSVTMQEFASHEPFYWRNVDNSCLRMYYSLYLYYHQAQKNTSFYPNLFKALREDKIDPYGANTNNSGLKFVRKVCEVAQEDLTDFFNVYGFFEPADNRYLECYGDHYVTNRLEDINSTKAIIAQYSTKNPEIIFVEDRVESVPTTGFVTTAGQQRWYRDSEQLGQCGDVGQFSAYLPENYQSPDYTYMQADNIFSIEGSGGVGFLIYDNDGNLVYASNAKNFSIPSSLGTNLTVYAMDANGTMQAVPIDNSVIPVQTVNVPTAGQLSQKVSGDANRVIKLIITGNINSKDIKYLRQLLDEGGLQAIDISGANIVYSRDNYDDSHHTDDNVMGTSAFEHFSQLISMKLPTSITSIDSWAFSSSGLKAIKIPDNVTSIGGDAFSYCGQLSSVVIGSNVSSLSQGVFYQSNVKDVYVKSLTPAETPWYLFSSNPTIHVYASKTAAYQASGWADYGTIVGDLERYDLDQEPVVPWTAVSLADNADNNAIINEFNASQETANVTLQGRTLFKDGAWNTLCLPFDLTSEQIAYNPLAGADIRKLNSASLSGDGVLTLNFTSVSSIEAGTPYIIKWNNGDAIVAPEFWGATISNATNDFVSGNIQFKGTYSLMTFNAVTRSILFMGEANTLYYPGTDAYIGAQRCYFKLNSSSNIKEFKLNFDDDEATVLKDLKDSKDFNNTIYNLAGQRLNKVQKGINIVNGKKITVK